MDVHSDTAWLEMKQGQRSPGVTSTTFRGSKGPLLNEDQWVGWSSRMYSIAQTWRSVTKSGQAPIDEYQWKDGILGRVGTKRVETKIFIRFENLRISQKEDHYWYSRRSHWFVKFPYCKNDKQILLANIVFFLIFLQLLGRVLLP